MDKYYSNVMKSSDAADTSQQVLLKVVNSQIGIFY